MNVFTDEELEEYVAARIQLYLDDIELAELRRSTMEEEYEVCKDNY